jgi:hypothetical protein
MRLSTVTEIIQEDSLNNNITRTLNQDLSIVEPIIIIMGRRHRSFAR